MSRSSLLIGACLMALAALEAGCADRPAGSGRGSTGAASVASRANRFGVSAKLLAAAANLGYNPKTVNGKTVFCQKEANTGSIIAQYHCMGAASLRLALLQQRTMRHQLERAQDQ
jgi:hypothetical protein